MSMCISIAHAGTKCIKMCFWLFRRRRLLPARRCLFFKLYEYDMSILCGRCGTALSGHFEVWSVVLCGRCRTSGRFHPCGVKTQADQNWRRFWRSFFAADAELRGFFKGWTVACCEIVVIFDLGHDDQFRVASGASDSFLWQAQ